MENQFNNEQESEQTDEGTEVTTNDEGQEPTTSGRKHASPSSVWGTYPCTAEQFTALKLYARDLGKPTREVVCEALAPAFTALFATVDETQEARDAARVTTKVSRIPTDPAKIQAEAAKLEGRLALLRARLGTAPTVPGTVAEVPSEPILEETGTPEELAEEAAAEPTIIQSAAGTIVVPASLEDQIGAVAKRNVRAEADERERVRDRGRRTPSGVR